MTYVLEIKKKQYLVFLRTKITINTSNKLTSKVKFVKKFIMFVKVTSSCKLKSIFRYFFL